VDSFLSFSPNQHPFPCFLCFSSSKLFSSLQLSSGTQQEMLFFFFWMVVLGFELILSRQALYCLSPSTRKHSWMKWAATVMASGS
jgi:hypothetical protein